ncbi:Aminoacyltransferase FemB [Weissella viridescens]|uniref:Aminoacyltransferase FemB n=1 Tax=Weissella viridescens TaxID=1629 RepID=A0A380NY05_WEIVI|nr:Aminoacyltransferase FemB [Weissella viridescens]
MITPQEVDYLFSGSYEQYGEFYGPHQIQDYMIQMTHDLGIDRYNFLGIDGRFDGSDGVMNFKTKFNGHVEQKSVLSIDQYKDLSTNYTVLVKD